jgi:hypothetical protein
MIKKVDAKCNKKPPFCRRRGDRKFYQGEYPLYKNGGQGLISLTKITH